MVERKYYSQRKANSSILRISFETLVKYFDGIHTIFYNKGYFNQVPSGSETELNLYSIEVFNKENMLPFYRKKQYSEEDIFDLVEFFYDYIEIPETYRGKAITSSNKTYLPEQTTIRREEKLETTKQEIQADYRKKINRVISKYDVGFELTEEGYVRELINNGLEELVDSPQVLTDDMDSEQRIKYARQTFFKHGATIEDKRGAIFQLGTVLEKLRDSKQLNLNGKDAGDLFTILNAFNIRHNRKDQKSGYDKEIFFPWIFYNLLAAIDASTKLQS
ncbi:hypothetical protein [Sporosarcina sp. G11-34]|uniref:hypothetical protein n=1 Tax=Sporosarcina sp. G11-34 TaxID=2849605 RepID=UPI0022A931B6|nr:hypothetical protein [Sporosarcina sp. G11-34]MCZ2259855.1 hypothetical protein [Sporosarcina sp. G11-34]